MTQSTGVEMETIVFVVYSKVYSPAAPGREPEIKGIFYTAGEAHYLARKLWAEIDGSRSSAPPYVWVERKPLTF